MKCRKCGRMIEKCIANNPDCKEKRHHLCEDCNDNIGLGLFDPCSKLVIENE